MAKLIKFTDNFINSIRTLVFRGKLFAIPDNRGGHGKVHASTYSTKVDSFKVIK